MGWFGEQGGLERDDAGESDGDRKSALVWDFMRLGFAGRVASLAAFGLIYSVLMILGLVLRESSQQLTIIWRLPACYSGALVFAAAAMGSGSWACRWPRRSRSMSHGTIILIGARTAIRPRQFDRRHRRRLIASRLMSTPEIPRLRHVLQFLAAVCARRRGKRRSGAFGSTQPLGSSHYFREWQLWWAGNCWDPCHRTGRDGLGRSMAHARTLGPVAAGRRVGVLGSALLGMTFGCFQRRRQRRLRSSIRRSYCWRW